MARILLIDDDETLRSLLFEALKRMGRHEIIEARNGAEGLRLCAGASLDLVITDILMPEKDGFEVLIGLRKFSPTPKVIAISGDGRDASSAYLKTAQRLGAAKVLQKPFSRQELIAAVDEVLGSSPPTPTSDAARDSRDPM